MVKDATGNLLKADVEALVNTVNCVGFMGKGIALQFRRAWPENFSAYRRAVTAGQVVPGHMHVFDTGRLVNPRYIVNFPTKRHWRGRTRLEDIRLGLTALIDEIHRLKIRSIAIPPLGCGNGGLDWRVVKPLILSAFESVPDVQVALYSPTGVPDARSMPVGTSRPKLTGPRALLLSLMDSYLTESYTLTLLEIQKLAYFLQVGGERLKLRYEQGHYGPYAPNLSKVLEILEGHYIRGLGDSDRPDQAIDLLPGAIDEAERFLADNEVFVGRLEWVSRLISGFETPYGLELLSSVHWLAHNPTPRTNIRDIVIAMRAWNERKRSLFRDGHVHVAWEQLAEHHVLASHDPGVHAPQD